CRSLPLRPTVHRAVLPAAVPLRATEFLGLKVGLFDSLALIARSPLVPGRRADRVILVQRAACSFRRRGESLLAGGEQRVQLLLEGVIADAVIQLGPGLHAVDHALLVAFGTNGVVDILRRL